MKHQMISLNELEVEGIISKQATIYKSISRRE